jgi:hypothetical protein
MIRKSDWQTEAWVGNMRKFAFAGAAVFVLLVIASNGAWAAPAQPPVSQNQAPVFDAKSPIFDPKSPIFQNGISNQDFSYSDEKIEALKKELNGKGDTGSGGHRGFTATHGSYNTALPDMDNNTDNNNNPSASGRRGR